MSLWVPDIPVIVTLLKERAKDTIFVPLGPIPPTHLHWTRTRTDTNADQSAASPEDLEAGPRAPESGLFAEQSHGEWEPSAPLGICGRHEDAEESRATEKSGNGAGGPERGCLRPWRLPSSLSPVGGQAVLYF